MLWIRASLRNAGSEAGIVRCQNHRSRRYGLLLRSRFRFSYTPCYAPILPSILRYPFQILLPHTNADLSKLPPTSKHSLKLLFVAVVLANSRRFFPSKFLCYPITQALQGLLSSLYFCCFFTDVLLNGSG